MSICPPAEDWPEANGTNLAILRGQELTPKGALGGYRRLTELASLRVLGLACLEGLYAVEFARQGARAVGIEGRDVNLEKVRFVKKALGLDNLDLHHDDVRNLSLEKYGEFDVVLCLGILYHLDAPDVFHFVESIGRVTRRSLYNVLLASGFTTVYECHVPAEVSKPLDRVALVAIKGQKPALLSTPKVNDLPVADWPEHLKPRLSQEQDLRARISKRLSHRVPAAVKRPVKAALQSVGLLKKDSGPWRAEARPPHKGADV